MQVELARCIATAQQALSELAIFSHPPRTPSIHPHSCALLESIAAAGIPKIIDSRVPDAINAKFHALADSYFQQACMSLAETHSQRDFASLQSTALQLQSTWTSLYEQQILKAASMPSKPILTHKQPFANDVLLYAFDQSQNPTRRQREVLASITGMTVEQVRVWFQNRRSRIKKKAPELQAHSNMQLDDVLGRVKAAHNASKTRSDCMTTQDDYEDDLDSGYAFGTSYDAWGTQTCPWPIRREVARLTVPIASARSYPSAYVPQRLSAEFHADPPCWRRVPKPCPPVNATTMTVDELARSMARLTLRHRRPAPAISATSPSDATTSASPVITEATKKRRTRNDAGTNRKIAGSQRVPTGPVAACSLPTGPTTWPLAVSAPNASDVPTKGRKKAGLPRRKPSGKTLLRHASDASIASTSSSSSDSSRSSSYASDFSFGSVASDFSVSSVESLPAPPDYASQPLLPAPDLAPKDAFSRHSQPPQEPRVPVYDLSSLTCDIVPEFVEANDMAELLNDADMMQLLQEAQIQQHHDNQGVVVSETRHELPLDAQSFDVGVACMDAFLDFSGMDYPSLDALLSDDLAGGGLHEQPRRHASLAPYIAQQQQQQQGFVWPAVSRLVASHT